MSPVAADPGVVTVLVAVGLLGYYVAVEPWWGRAVYARLARLRPHDPGALIAFARLTVGVQVAATAAVVLAVLADPGVGAASIAAIDLRALLLSRPAAVPEWARAPEG